QGTPPGPGGMPPGGPGQGMDRMHRQPAMKPTEQVEAQLAYVKTALKITPAQQAQWDAYADFMRKDAQDMEQRFDARRKAGPQARTARPNAIERLEMAQNFSAQAAQRIEKRLQATKPLYAALSPDQQRVADRLLAPRPRFEGRGGRGEHGGRGRA